MELQDRLITLKGGPAVIEDLKIRNGSVDHSRKPILLNALVQWGLERDGVEAMGPALIDLRDELMRDLKIPPFDT